MQMLISTIIDLCGPLLQNKNADGVSVYDCRDGGEVLTFEYEASKSVLPAVWRDTKFYVPAHKDVDAAVNLGSFNYHIVDIKPVNGLRDFAAPFEWVDQPYFYKLRCKWKGKKAYSWDDLDRIVRLRGSVNDRVSHNGPHKEHDSLQACAKRGSDAYKKCLDNYNIMWHMSVHFESYFLLQKFWDHAKPGTATQTKDPLIKERHFCECFSNPGKSYNVFKDNFVQRLFGTEPHYTRGLRFVQTAKLPYPAKKLTWGSCTAPSQTEMLRDAANVKWRVVLSTDSNPNYLSFLPALTRYLDG
eukprot:8115653-Ditylum_brightwellii.AAC.1